MEPEPEFRKQVKDALEHLYNAAYLEMHPLLSQFPNQPSDSRLIRAQKLRNLLTETIEALRPPGGSPWGSPEWRSYLALDYRYLQKMRLEETEVELSISPRQLQRELHKGLDAVAAVLWDKRTTVASPVLETQELENELHQWEISRQSCEVQTLVDDTLWMCKPFLAERGVVLDVDIPVHLDPVLVDATLTRQALFKVLRALARNPEPGPLSLEVREEGEHTNLVLRRQGIAGFENEEDWKTAQLICQQQGNLLTVNPLADGRTEIVLMLSRTRQPRVLVIDNNAAIPQLFERYLAPHHYEIIPAYSGDQALQLAAEKHPDAITLDVMMPNVDGWQVLRSLTANPATAHIPIVICSVLREPELAFSLGARAYLKKPVDRLELVATLARLLSPAAPAAAAPQSTPEDN